MKQGDGSAVSKNRTEFEHKPAVVGDKPMTAGFILPLVRNSGTVPLLTLQEWRFCAKIYWIFRKKHILK